MVRLGGLAPAVAETEVGPRLQVWRSSRGDGSWVWVIRSPDGRWLDGGTVSTHGRALREGFAAMSQLGHLRE